MVIYISEYDSPEDPQGILKQTLAMGSEFPGPAADVFLAWTLRLGLDSNVAEAARAVIRDYHLDTAEDHGGEHAKLVTLIREAAKGQTVTARRRGGARGRNRSQS
ncbi:hypothetical protein [Limibacillus sp. MBR-115]|jgi:hypothetical protein|uniref:hypothetical protein n=1 Tax=Limibacillus sp. MBR-115 TaxID=3156465 RepID=UPI0033952BF9